MALLPGAAALAVCLLLACAPVLQAAVTSPGLTNNLVELITKRRYEDFIKELAKDGMDANQPDGKGRLPLMEAVRAHDTRYVDALIQYNAQAHSKDPATGQAPIQLAFATNQAEAARLLLAYGADIDMLDKSGKKARDYAPTKDISDLIALWDLKGALAFEDAPGTWTKTTNDKGLKYWYNAKTKVARWNVPPSCGWQRVQFQGAPSKFVNYVTQQTVTRLPPALSWRLVHLKKEEVWFNWASNHTQHASPDELPADMLEEAKTMKNVRWYNHATKQYSWEDPRYLTSWRTVKEDNAEKPYYYNVATGESTWDVPEDLAWREETSGEPYGRPYWFNAKTGESSWDAPDSLSWLRQDSEL